MIQMQWNMSAILLNIVNDFRNINNIENKYIFILKMNKKQDSFREFRKLCKNISCCSSYKLKTDIIKKHLSNVNDVYLTIKFLLPNVNKIIYNLNDKQLIKIFSSIFECSTTNMLDHLEQGYISETIKTAFETNEVIVPCKKSTISIKDVDIFLTALSTITKYAQRLEYIKGFIGICTANDLKCIVMLIKHDLRINAGAKHVLDALHDNAYKAFNSSTDLKSIVDGYINNNLIIQSNIMIPIQPMLAEACNSIEHIIKKYQNGMYVEIKYDGERVQIHKNKSNEFKFFSRNLKPVLSHKVDGLSEYISNNYNMGCSMILDSEIVVVCEDKILPFGTLGIHKKSEYKNSQVCVFIFDCLFFNDINVMNMPYCERRKILKEYIIEIPNRVMLSECYTITCNDELNNMIQKVIEEGIEGLVIKDIMSTYEPGKRHWLKIKKDYLQVQSIIDSVDLVVLGAYYGKGSKGGKMSIFLMGCYDPIERNWRTVTKCSTGYNIKTLEKIQNELTMIKIGKQECNIPSWLKIKKIYYPDFIVEDPTKSPVWEVTGASFSKSMSHTADGISIRFPRFTRIRDDKDWLQATNLSYLKILFSNSCYQ
ncbi:DNA ligase-like protein [Cetacean poxvirus 1]|nr:DNA ligase-like protein [Cetacean poxvirus 1]